MMNALSSKGGKAIQVGGTALKIIPLFTVSLIAIIAVASVASGELGDLDITSPDKNPGLDGATGLE
jgi:hypothetical protein